MGNDLADFVQKAKEGKREAFGKLFELTNNKAYYTALKITENPRDAEDMVQEAYIKAFNSISSLEDNEKFEKWLNRIVANNCRDLAKKRKPDLFSNYENDEAGSSFEDSVQNTDISLLPEEVTENKSVKKLVMSCVDKLPEEQRMCVVMFYYDELSVNEIAETLCIPVGTVKSRLSKARKTLKSQFEVIEKKDNIKLHSIPMPAIMSLAFRLSSESCKIPNFSLFRITKSISEFVSDGNTSAVIKAIGISAFAKKVIAGVGAVAIITGGSIAARNIIEDKNNNSVAETTAVVAQYNSSKTKGKANSKSVIQSAVDSVSDKIIVPSALAIADDKNNVYYIDDDGVICEDENGEIKIISSHKPRNLYFGDSLMYIYDDILYQYKENELTEYMQVKGEYLYGGTYRLVSISADKRSAYLIDVDNKSYEEFDSGSTDFKYLGNNLYYRNAENNIMRATIKKEKIKKQELVSCNTQDNLKLPYAVKSGKIYYTDFNSDIDGMLHIKTIKNERIQSVELNGGIRDFTVSEGRIYYSLTTGGLYFYDEEEGITELAQGNYYCGATSHGNMLWCSADSKDAYLIESAKSELIPVEGGSDIIEFSIVNDIIYCRSDNGYTSIPLWSESDG